MERHRAPLPYELAIDGIGKNHGSRNRVTLKAQVLLDESPGMRCSDLHGMQAARLRRYANAPVERCRGIDSRKPTLHEHERMRTPCVAVAARLLSAIHLSIGGLKRRFQVLLDIVPPEIETFQEEIGTAEPEIRIEKVIRKVHRTAGKARGGSGSERG